MTRIHLMGRKKLGRKSCNVTLPEKLKRAAEKQAAIEGIPLSYVIEKLLVSYLGISEDSKAKKSDR